MAVSSGSGETDYKKTKSILAAISDIKYICLDVANGYSEHFVDFLRNVRKDFPNHTILVSEESLWIEDYSLCVCVSIGRQRCYWRNGRRAYFKWC